MRKYIAAFLIAFSSYANAENQAEERLIAALHSAKHGLSVQSVAESAFGRNGEQYIAAMLAEEPENGSVHRSWGQIPS